jgi:hypothetical protein
MADTSPKPATRRRRTISPSQLQHLVSQTSWAPSGFSDTLEGFSKGFVDVLDVMSPPQAKSSPLSHQLEVNDENDESRGNVVVLTRATLEKRVTSESPPASEKIWSTTSDPYVCPCFGLSRTRCEYHTMCLAGHGCGGRLGVDADRKV